MLNFWFTVDSLDLIVPDVTNILAPLLDQSFTTLSTSGQIVPHLALRASRL